jgi:hypothetical protein
MDDPTFINYLRIAYIAAQLISLGIYLYIQAQVSGGFGGPICGAWEMHDRLTCFVRQIKKKNDLTTLKYVQPASPMVRFQFLPTSPLTRRLMVLP